MKLTEAQAKQLRDIDFVETVRKARKESAHLLDDHGLAALALALSNLLVQIVEDSNCIIKEFYYES